jgi:hypothetical protein
MAAAGDIREKASIITGWRLFVLCKSMGLRGYWSFPMRRLA